MTLSGKPFFILCSFIRLILARSMTGYRSVINFSPPVVISDHQFAIIRTIYIHSMILFFRRGINIYSRDPVCRQDEKENQRPRRSRKQSQPRQVKRHSRRNLISAVVELLEAQSANPSHKLKISKKAPIN